ncbi:putative GDP-GTP exchange factor [Parelaphostrongylus tenuis]|uniref:GDP-GTP exchange factor n=1 Tax=Parelaphostrongylus tenuis TaxID=148309 RepID=A0AAD5R395_PARTN|nr:putative GDP-GTP exchange factor [Parelaphostrongylus tenuis]
MSVVQPPPHLMHLAQTQVSLPPDDIDLEGGRLIDVVQEEEIDATDGCRVQVVIYRIESADGTEQLTKTIRRKIKFDCTQTSRRLEMSNGKEAKVEEKCERYQGDIKGFRPVEITQNNKMLQLDPNDAQDVAISNVLGQVPDTFMSMLSKEKEYLVKMFPDLFTQMRAQSSVIPASTTEVITNPDGTTTTRVRSSKSYSSHFSKQETFINGVKQMSKSTFKAFVEYKGPEGGFRVKLTDNGDDLSEEETEDDDRASRCYSEITDSESDIQPYTPQTKQQTEVKKRQDKAWYAAKELVDSEQRYVNKLRLLDEQFRQRVVKETAIDKDKQLKLFANISSLYQFHNTHFLPQLMEASRDWHTTKRIANVVRKQAPFLKMYSEYTNNYDRATRTFEEMKKKKKFADIVREVEKSPECEGLPLSHHLICPVQRVMRYQLLLQEYKKHLTEKDADYTDADAALQLVLEAASHANEMMKKLDGFGKVVEVQEQLGNSISLVSPGRELLKTGTLQKISSTTEKTEERTIFLFNDLILLAGERKMIGLYKYRLRAVFHACHTQICEGDNLEREHSFYIRGSDGNGPQRCIELFSDSQKDKNDWVESICAVIEDCRANSATFGGSNVSPAAHKTSVGESNNNYCESRNCADCDTEFSLFYRGVKCGKCRRKLCKKCFGRYRSESKNQRICEPCVKNMGFETIRRSTSAQSNGRPNVLATPAQGKGILHASMVKFRGSLGKTFERYFVVRNDFCLYSYLSPDDECALAMLPLPGCEVKLCGERFTFSLRVGSRRMYTVTVDDEQNQLRWMAVLDLAANVQLQQMSEN